MYRIWQIFFVCVGLLIIFWLFLATYLGAEAFFHVKDNGFWWEKDITYDPVLLEERVAEIQAEYDQKLIDAVDEVNARWAGSMSRPTPEGGIP